MILIEVCGPVKTYWVIFRKSISVLIFGLGYIGELIWETLPVIWVSALIYCLWKIKSVEIETTLKPLSYGRQEERYNCLLWTPFQEFCLLSFYVCGNCSQNLSLLSHRWCLSILPYSELTFSGHCGTWTFLVGHKYFPVLGKHCPKQRIWIICCETQKH